MDELNILFGFEESKFQRDVERALRGYGYTPTIACKYSKASIAKFLKENTQFSTVVLKEVMGRSPYTDIELAALTEERDINIIIVLTERHKGTSYMETLYAAGITGALFQNGNETDATVTKVVDLILHKRRRVDARKYYGIMESPAIQLDKISDNKLSDLLHALDDSSYGETLGARFAMLCQTLTVPQVVEFIKKIPTDVLKQLEQSDDYWKVIAALEKHHVTIKSRKYNEQLKNYSKRNKVAGNSVKQLDDKSLTEEYIPSKPVGSVPIQSGVFEEEEEKYISEEEFTQEVEEEYEEEEVTPEPPKTTDWRELKRWEEEQARLAKKKKKESKYKKTAPARPQPEPRQHRSPSSESRPARKDASPRDSRDVLMKLGIAVGVLIFIALLVVVVIGVNYMTQSNALKQTQEQEVLSEQMSDLAVIRSGEAIDTTNTTPVTTSVVNGEQLMGLSVLDIINTDSQLFYVVNLDGALYTYESGGATSAEIFTDSMYYTQLLPSGHFAFYQQ